LTLIDLAAIAPRLTRDADGIWRAPRARPLDYPDDANAFCFGVEEASFWFRHRNRVIVEAVRRRPPGGAIADIGAGNGYVSLALQQAGFETIVIEPGPVGAGNARDRGLSPVVCATLEEAGFENGTLAAAGLFDVLEHIADDLGFLAVLRERLAPGARVYVTVPAFQALWSAEDELVGHHRRYSIPTLADSLRRCGYGMEYASYFFSPLPLPLFVLRTLPSRLGIRTSLDPAKTKAELQPSPLVGRAMTRLLAYEAGVVRRGRRIPFGTSCLAVARATSHGSSGRYTTRGR
jgi:SAM-dependent methyltransferase